MPTPKKHATAAARQRAYRERERSRRLAEKPLVLPQASSIGVMPSVARWRAMQAGAAGVLRQMVAEMESYRDDRSEAWQESQRAEAFEERLERAQEAIDAVEAIA